MIDNPNGVRLHGNWSSSDDTVSIDGSRSEKSSESSNASEVEPIQFELREASDGGHGEIVVKDSQFMYIPGPNEVAYSMPNGSIIIYREMTSHSNVEDQSISDDETVINGPNYDSDMPDLQSNSDSSSDDEAVQKVTKSRLESDDDLPSLMSNSDSESDSDDNENEVMQVRPSKIRNFSNSNPLPSVVVSNPLPSSKDKKKKKKKRNKKKKKKKKKVVYTSREQDRGNGSDDDEEGYADAKEDKHSLSEGSRNDLFPSDVSNSDNESDGDVGSIQGSLEDELTNMRLNPSQASERHDRSLEILRGSETYDPNRRTLSDLIQAGLRRERNDPRSIEEVVQEVIADRLHGLQESKSNPSEVTVAQQLELEGDPYEEAARALRMTGLDRDDDEGEDEPPIAAGSSSSSESGGNTRNRKSKRGRFGFYDIDGISKFMDEDGLLSTLVPSGNLPELFAYEDSSYPGGTPRATCTIGNGEPIFWKGPKDETTTPIDDEDISVESYEDLPDYYFDGENVYKCNWSETNSTEECESQSSKLKPCYMTKVNDGDSNDHFTYCLDSMANVNVFRNRDLLTNVREGKRPMNIDGVGGKSVTIRMIG